MIDQSMIQELLKLEKKTGKGLVKELVELYVSSAPVAVQNMKKYLVDQMWKDLTREAHTLKSSSANLGAVPISEACKNLEYALIQDVMPGVVEIKTMIVKIEDLLLPTVEEMKSLGRG